MLLSEARNRYLSFMQGRGHRVLPSAPLAPREDSTTLFTGSGMQPLVPYLLGKEHQEGALLTNSQKCFRANDIEEVGDRCHTTFFEMLGNWSLGGYFKEEQIASCYSFLTDREVGLGLDPARLYVTAFAGDDSLGIPRDSVSAELWRKIFSSAGVTSGIAHIGSQEDGDRRGMREGERIFFYDGSKNWWSRSGDARSMPVGEPGGPDTEVFYDFGEEHTDPSMAHLLPHPNTDSGRFIELCNSVFMEYVRTEDGFDPLPKKNVDFGGGLERMVAATEHAPDIFRIDAFAPCIRALESASGKRYEDVPIPFRILADHLRAAVFIIADGVTPATTDQGYVLRRLIRSAAHALRYGLAVQDAALAPLSDHFVTAYRDQYPEVASCPAGEVIGREEEQFARTLRSGMRVFQGMAKRGTITGEDVFLLQSTYGFPKELAASLADQHGVPISFDGYDSAMREHRESSRRSTDRRFKGGLADTDALSTRYHTATHLLHQALRDVLGETVEQKGSNITPERLRFDFTSDAKLTDAQRDQVESIVNGKIQAALPVTFRDMPIEEARALGAIGSFEYGSVVRVYCIGEYSKEFCGGPHVENTADLGAFRIVRDEAVAAGIRRVRAVLE